MKLERFFFLQFQVPVDHGNVVNIADFNGNVVNIADVVDDNQRVVVVFISLLVRSSFSPSAENFARNDLEKFPSYEIQTWGCW